MEMMNGDEGVAKIRELIKEIEFCMLTTVDDEGRLHSRPMAASNPGEFNGDLWFFTYGRSHKGYEVSQNRQVNCDVSHTRGGSRTCRRRGRRAWSATRARSAGGGRRPTPPGSQTAWTSRTSPCSAWTSRRPSTGMRRRAWSPMPSRWSRRRSSAKRPDPGDNKLVNLH